jgi:hypothetical protein
MDKKLEVEKKQKIAEFKYNKDIYLISLDKYSGINYTTHDFENCIICQTFKFQKSDSLLTETYQNFLLKHRRRYGYDYCVVNDVQICNTYYYEWHQLWDAILPLTDLVYTFPREDVKSVIFSASELDNKVLYRPYIINDDIGRLYKKKFLMDIPNIKEIQQTSAYIFSDSLKFELNKHVPPS